MFPLVSLIPNLYTIASHHYKLKIGFEIIYIGIKLRLSGEFCKETVPMPRPIKLKFTHLMNRITVLKRIKSKGQWKTVGAKCNCGRIAAKFACGGNKKIQIIWFRLNKITWKKKNSKGILIWCGDNTYITQQMASDIVVNVYYPKWLLFYIILCWPHQDTSRILVRSPTCFSPSQTGHYFLNLEENFRGFTKIRIPNRVYDSYRYLSTIPWSLSILSIA